MRISAQSGTQTGRRRTVRLLLSVCAASAALLLLLPAARSGAMVLCNRLFAASEAANAYAYTRFAVSPAQNALTAEILLGIFMLGWGGLCLVTRSRLPLLLCAAAAAGVQAYFGLSLPDWGNIALFGALGLGMLRPDLPLKSKVVFAAALAVIAACALLLFPGVDEATEAASERVRDRLSVWAQAAGGAAPETPEETREVRRVNSQSLQSGEEDGHSIRDYRLVTVEEQQISRPRWIDYLRIALLLFASVALVALPFSPFLLLNARRKKAQQARAAFDSADISEAICALFRHAAAYWSACGYGGGNRPFRAWADAARERLPRGYLCDFQEHAALFEEALYSGHPMTEEQRQGMRRFLEATEQIFYENADWKEKARLRYIKCLHE